MSLIYQPNEDSYFLSEVLEEEISELARPPKNLKFLEIGCGAGIILQTALVSGIKKENIFGIDINKDAVEHCKKLGFNCVQSNLFSKIKGKFNLIVFNPPYLPEDKQEDKESKLATTGGKQGGELINKFLKQAKNHLSKNGKIFLLTSSLTKGIEWLNYKKEKIATKKLFFEELYIWKITS
jgi:release factor glutamine methyltransferase